MISLAAKELAQIVHGSLLNPAAGFDKLKFKGVSIDSRTVQPGNLFVALPGERQDGHDFLADAFKRKAALLLIEKSKSEKIPANLVSQIPVVAVKDTKAALQELAIHYRGKFDIPVIAITGSNGKTTTKEMLAHVLGAKFNVLKSQKSFNTQVGIPLTIFELSPRTEMMVLEMGTSQLGEIARLSEIARPTAALILNIGPAHLETFQTLENVAKAKFELLEKLPSDKPVFLNVDDPYLKRRAVIEKHKVISYAIDTEADYRALDVLISGNAHLDFMLKKHGIRLNLLGRHNIYNALAVFAVAEFFGLSPVEIVNSLKTFHPARLRMEIMEIGGFKVINDSYNANPASMSAALEALKVTKTSGKRIAVLGDMLELGAESPKLHQEVGKLVARLGIDYLITIGELAQEIARAARTGKITIESFPHNREAGLRLKELVQPGDTLLLKGSRKMKLEEIAEMLKGEKEEKS